MLPEFTLKNENLEEQKEKIVKQIEENKKSIEKLLKIPEKTYENFVKPFELMNEKLEELFTPVAHLNSVKNSPETQQVFSSLLPLITEYSTTMLQDERIYRAFKEIYEKEKVHLDQEKRRVLENLLRDFKLNGVHLPADRRERVKEISIKLSSLSNNYAQNVLNAIDNYELIIDNPEDVRELPDVERKNAEIEKGGKKVYRFTLHQPSYLAYMTYGSNREKREELFKAYVTKAPENDELITEILALRYEKANLLGFKNFAELSLQPKMADTPDEVLDFLYKLARESKPQALKEYEELNELAHKQGLNDNVQSFDFYYYSEKLKKEKFNVDDESYKPYFEQNNVLTGLFTFLNKLFGLEFEKIEAKVWHPAVKVYHIFRRGEFIGRIYYDLEAREGKRSGAWMNEWVTHHENEKGEIVPPVAFVVANFPPSSDETPSLLRPMDVRTLFHEMGHALYHLLSRVKEPFVSGNSGVEWDAVEFPSQFLENFAYEKEVLKLFAKHYKTGETIPDELIKKLKAVKNFLAGLMMLRQLEFGLFDMRIHLDKYTSKDVHRILWEVRDEIAVIKPPEYDRFYWSFNHIFAGGYAAGYYSYKWAEVLSADAFLYFVKNGIFNREIADRFYEQVFTKGGSVPARKLFKDFFGRDPDPESLLKLSGIKGGNV